MKIKERDVAGASSGDRFFKHTRSGGGAQQQRPEEGGPESVSFRGLEAGRARTMGKIAARSIMVLAVMRRPLRVRCIQHQRALGAPRQLAEVRGKKGAQSHGARVFAAAFSSARIFFCGGGCNRLSVGVSCCWRGLGVRAAASPRDEAGPHARVEGGVRAHVRRPPPPAGREKGALAWAHYVKTAFPHSPRIPTGSFGGPERWMDAWGLLGRLRWRLRRRPWERGRELLGAFAAHLLAFTGNLLGSAPRV